MSRHRPAKPAPKAAPKPEPKIDQPTHKGFGAFFARQVEKFRNSRPDHSFDGFIKAVREGIAFVGTKNWNTADDMLEELEHQIRTSLRVPSGVICDFVARDAKTNQPRILILTDWGFREAVEGTINFQLHFKPGRQPLQPVK